MEDLIHKMVQFFSGEDFAEHGNGASKTYSNENTEWVPEFVINHYRANRSGRYFNEKKNRKSNIILFKYIRC